MLRILLLIVGLTTLVAVQAAGRVIDDRALADESNTSEWLAYGRTLEPEDPQPWWWR